MIWREMCVLRLEARAAIAFPPPHRLLAEIEERRGEIAPIFPDKQRLSDHLP
jgi:hypothetical protein